MVQGKCKVAPLIPGAPRDWDMELDPIEGCAQDRVLLFSKSQEATPCCFSEDV